MYLAVEMIVLGSFEHLFFCLLSVMSFPKDEYILYINLTKVWETNLILKFNFLSLHCPMSWQYSVSFINFIRQSTGSTEFRSVIFVNCRKPFIKFSLLIGLSTTVVFMVTKKLITFNYKKLRHPFLKHSVSLDYRVFNGSSKFLMVYQNFEQPYKSKSIQPRCLQLKPWKPGIFCQHLQKLSYIESVQRQKNFTVES